jgi:AbrB family looped-hinge helix DNA binding protein
VKITSKGQVTIPVSIRRRLGLMPETEVEFVVEGAAVRIRKGRGAGRRGESLIARLRGRAATRLTTDDILALTRR